MNETANLNQEDKYTHTHVHTHEHMHIQVNKLPEKMNSILSLLNYMYSHNESHLEEMQKIADAIYEAGNSEQAQQMELAMECFQKSNQILHEIFDQLVKV